jgi:molybdopterin-guanine dinucleotide biosynthesis protein A
MNLVAALLTGGESRRMGRDKATLLFDGEPLWQRQLTVLRESGPIEIFISARVDPPWRPREVKFVADTPPSRGPLSGLTACLALLPPDWHLLVLAVDMPFMTSAFLLSLRAIAAPDRGVLPMIGDRAEPLAAIYPKAAQADFATALASSDFSLQPIARRLVRAGKFKVRPLLKDEEAFFGNLNEVKDLAG